MASEVQVADVPEALRAETESRTRAILDAALDCVVSIDHRGLITYFNPAAEETFGYRSEQAVGRDLAEDDMSRPVVRGVAVGVGAGGRPSVSNDFA